MEEGTREVRWNRQVFEVEPLPWYYEIIQAARECHVPPWEMLDEKTPRRFWTEAILIVSGAESAARKTRQDRAEAIAAANQQQRESWR